AAAVVALVRGSGAPLPGPCRWRATIESLLARFVNTEPTLNRTNYVPRCDCATGSLVFVPGIADPIAAFLGHGVGAIAMQDTEIEVVMRRQMPYTGDKCLFKRSIVGPFRESFVDCRVMDSRLS